MRQIDGRGPQIAGDVRKSIFCWSKDTADIRKSICVDHKLLLIQEHRFSHIKILFVQEKQIRDP